MKAKDKRGNLAVDTSATSDEKLHLSILASSRVSAAISGLWDLDAILNIALENALNIAGPTHVGGILLLEEQDQTLSYQVYHGLSNACVEEVRLKIGEGIAGKVAQTGKLILLQDVSNNPQDVCLDLLTAEGVKGFISIPLKARNRVKGVMNIASRQPSTLTKVDMYLLSSIGDQVGVAIEWIRLYEQLRKSRERYRQLAQQILAAQEEERKRIARELHDDASQVISALALNLQALMDMTETPGTQDAQVFKAGLKKAHGLAIHAGEEIKRVMSNLHPALLDTLGVIPAIRQYTETTLHPLGIAVSWEIKEGLEDLPPEVEVVIFRAAQEAVNNIAWHSGAKNAALSLEQKGDELLLRISDDGQGFDVLKLTKIDNSGRGRGVFGIKERVRTLDGSCVIESRPGKGTTVNVKIPITWRDNVEDKGVGGR
jgi:signal transduction histidine kinase